MKLLVIVLISWMLVACGGADEVSTSSTATPTTQANLPQPAAKAATVLGGNDIAVRMYQALYGKAPSNAQLSGYAAQIASSGESAFAAAVAAEFANTSHTVLAKLVLDNLGVTTTTVTASGEYATLLDALGQMFAYYGTGARGQIILNATKLLVDLTTDPTYGVAAVAYNNQAQANITYSTNSANTTEGVASTAVVREIAAGWGHAMILKSDGTVWAWGGMNDYGQHGTGTSNRGANPLPVQSLISSVSQISAGSGHSVAVKSDGSIWSWGDNGWYRLGNTSGSTSTPVVMSSLTNPRAVSAGSSHTMVLKSDGTVWGVGKSRDGQLCNGETLGTDSPWYNTGHATPVQMVGANGVGYMSSVIAVGTGDVNTAVVKSDGTVWMCGWMQHLVPGRGSWNTAIPIQVAGLTGAVDVAVADYRMYALKSDGTVWSLGLIVSDMVQYNGSTDTATAVQVAGLSDVVAISSHTSHTLALKRDGTVWSWGQNEWGWGQDEWGKLGNNLKGDSATPVQVVGPNGIGYLSGITAIDTGSNSSLALKNDGTVWAWGENSYGYLGNGGTTRSSFPTQVAGLTASTLLAPSSLAASAISAAVALTWTEVTGAKSYNIYRSSLRADTGTLLANTVSINYSDASALSGTTYYYYVTAVAGALESIPSNKVAAQAGTSTGGGTSASTMKSVGGGYYHSAALGNDGSMWSWGSNNFGELGKGTTSDSSTPAKLTSISGVSAASGGNDHMVALKSDGTVWAWGYNYHGELGNGTKTGNTANATPGQVMTAAATPLTGITAVRGGFWHNLALKSDGTVWAWGNNDYGQLGNGSVTPSYGGVAYATQVTGLSNVVAIAAGHWHSVAVKSDGSVWTWGLNYTSYDANRNGQLGDGTTTSRLSPVRVLGVGGVGYLSGVVKVAAGSAFTLALKSDGTVFGWGTNLEGELGNGNKTTSLTPVQAGVSNITDLAAGYWLSLALKSDGTVWAWGQNDMGQLGNGTTQALTGVSTPAAVSGLSSVTAIHAGAIFGLALKSDGTVWAWGENTSGQLGNGSTSNSSTPVRSQGGGL